MDASLPIGIIRRAENKEYGAWELVYDHAIFLNHRHRHAEEPKWVGRYIRIDQPMDMVAAESVPFEERPGREARSEDRQRARRAEVEKWADEFVRGERDHRELRDDFQLEREVMDELWSRFREVTGDRFLLAALADSAGQPDGPDNANVTNVDAERESLKENADSFDREEARIDTFDARVALTECQEMLAEATTVTDEMVDRACTVLTDDDWFEGTFPESAMRRALEAALADSTDNSEHHQEIEGSGAASPHQIDGVVG